MYNYALIGCGQRGRLHAEQIARAGRLVAVCDLVEERAAAFGRTYNATVYTDLDKLLENETEVAIVSVCTPNGMHAEHTIKSLQNGRHVVCEKPLCIAAPAAWSMMDTAHFFRRKLFVVNNTRYNSVVDFVKKTISENKLGRILGFHIDCIARGEDLAAGDWKGTKELGGGLLYTRFSHFIGLLYNFLGDVDEVTGYLQHDAHSEIETGGAASIKMKCGAIGTLSFTTSGNGHPGDASFTLRGEKGTVQLGGQDLETIRVLQGADGLALNPLDHDGLAQDSLATVYSDATAAIEQKKNVMQEIRESVKTIEIIESIYARSVEQR